MAFNSQVKGKYIVLGEVNIVVTALRRNIRWSTHNYQSDHEDPLISSFNSLKNVLNRCEDLSELGPSVYLTPFLEVVRSEDTTGPITGLALSSINKFLSYTLIDNKSPNIALAVSAMADAVTHARFVGTDPANDEVVLMKILQVLRILLLTNIGVHLTNEAVCEIMQSCFRICFEMRLSELLRKSAEHTLVDMVQVLFTRLPEFTEDMKDPSSSTMKRLKMRAGGMGDAGTRGKGHKKSSKRKKNEQKKNNQHPPQILPAQEEKPAPQTNGEVESTEPKPVGNVTLEASDAGLREANENDTENKEPEVAKEDNEANDSHAADNDEGAMADTENGEKEDGVGEVQRQESAVDAGDELELQSQISENGSVQDAETSNNPRGVRFTASPHASFSGPLLPYGLPCVRELFRFLISLTNPHDRHNSDVMIHMGMSLLMVALEVSHDEIGKFPSLLLLVKDDMCRYLFQLLSVERLGLVASSIRVSLLLFQSLRKDLKFQLEQFLKKLMDLISSDNPKLSYEAKELSLEAVVQLWHIPGLVTELYLNYDCDFYCSNMFEDLSKLLSKNAFPVSGLYTTHLLSLEALLTVVRSVEQRCNQREIVRNDPDINPFEPTKGTQSTTPVSTPLKSTPMWTSSVPPCGQNVGENLVNQNLDGKAAPEAIPDKVPPRFSGTFPLIEELQQIKQKKKILQSGTELFNQKPKKGIAFLQEQNLLAVPLDTREVSKWLRVNPWLDKKMIGEYISDRRNPEILDGFVRTFKFEGLRVDESLRMYLETFRLPGEAPVIQRLIEAFSAYWSECNHHPFMNLDAAFTLSYAIIMLNTDQHNRNVRKQNEPMNMNDFKRNVKGCNGGIDFEQAMLEEIYNTIRNDEIVLPEEQVGPIRDKWLWNLFLRRGSSSEGIWLQAPSTGAPNGTENLHIYDRDLFAMNWGPTVSALSYVFDKSLDEQIIQKSITGYRKCALISAHFGMSDVFDNLIVSLCKFTTLANGGEAPEAAAIGFGVNGKAQLAARTAFHLAHRHGDILREGWRNIFDIILPFYRAELLPTAMVEVEDFVDPTGRISLIREKLPMQRSDSSIFSSFYQFMTLGGGPGDNSSQKSATAEDQEALRLAQECVKELQLETLVTESKFLRLDSLQELIKALMDSSRGPHTHEQMGTTYSEDSAIFFLELLLRVILQNRDRILSLWQMVRDHLYTIVVMATDYSLLLERAVVGLLRMAIRLLHREDVAEEVLASLQILLMIKPCIIPKVSRQIGYGLHELLRTNAANIHSREDWITIFTVMKCVGAGAVPPPILHVPAASNADLSRQPSQDTLVSSDGSHLDRKTHSDSETAPVGDRNNLLSDRGYTSDSELYENHPGPPVEADVQKLQKPLDKSSTIQVIPPPPTPCNQFTLQLGEELRQHDMRCMVKSCETLAFLVRDAAHVTPDNFELCVRCIRTFVEASINGVNRAHHAASPENHVPKQLDKKKLKKRKERDVKRKTSGSPVSGRYLSGQASDDETAVENVPGGYHTLSLQLLDLMHTLHTRAASIYSSWAEEERKRIQSGSQALAVTAEASNLWDKCWCPLLQGIARLCCDARRQVRTSALTYLQRALLVHDLQTLTGKEWESCFNKVLFPLLTKLLENISPADPDGMEETRMRGATLLSKVFLQHLTPLLTLPTFTALWLTILDFMDKYMHVGKRDVLYEAIPESLKNMLLVMDTAGIFHSAETPSGYTSLWDVTWERIDCFLPNLKSEVFKPPTPEPKKRELIAPKAPEVPRECARPSTPQNVPYSSSPPKSQLISASPINPAGIIAAPLPKITPPTSLNVAPPPGVQLAAPYAPPTNPVPIVPFSASVRALGLSQPKQLVGLGGPLVSQPQQLTPSSMPANILMTPSTPNFLVTTPLPHPAVSQPPTSQIPARTAPICPVPVATEESPVDSHPAQISKTSLS
ncbi:Golgi-specific brefeldin A-resistance guanine nucleotide exchange factor 1-like isoform X2 [Clavelina lepadiformis]|uniref:Golgi-specific brefeldin A-resistance guanine nucleotide exchange factor 1-like isoform X2 n=1 Tax=Clavelina lepadiformis TaxID=159417 RepID=UPI00404252E4